MGLITEYKCPNCGAPLAFDADSGEVGCKNCGSCFTVEQIIESQGTSSTEEFDWGNYKAGLSSEVLEGTAIYQCQSCGAVLETDQNTVATSCPYCDNNIVLTDRVSAGLKPNAVVPFAIDKKQLKDIVNNFYKGKKLLPKNFFNESKIDKILGVYIPFWLFDCDVEGRVDFRAERITHHETSRESITTTYHYLLRREGEMKFSNVPVDASTQMDNALMDSLEPFDFSKMVPFDGAYLSGFVADRFDSDPDKEIQRANNRVINTTLGALESTTGGYQSVSPRSNDLYLKSASVKYVLLPAYIINCDYNGKKYQYAVNGQTGKIVGELPSSKSLQWGFFFKAFGIALAAGLLLGGFLL